MTSDPTRDLVAMRRRDGQWSDAEFDGIVEHPDTQCSADLDRHALLAALSTTPAPDSLRAICVVCGERGHVRSTGGTVLTGGHDNPSGHEFTPATDFSHDRSTPAPDPLREALERIANMDYRGNPSQEQEVARTALRTYRRDRIYGKTP